MPARRGVVCVHLACFDQCRDDGTVFCSGVVALHRRAADSWVGGLVCRRQKGADRTAAITRCGRAIPRRAISPEDSAAIWHRRHPASRDTCVVGHMSADRGGLRAGSPPSPPRARSDPPSGVSRGPRAFGSGSPSSLARHWASYALSPFRASAMGACCVSWATICRNSPRISPWLLSR